MTRFLPSRLLPLGAALCLLSACVPTTLSGTVRGQNPQIAPGTTALRDLSPLTPASGRTPGPAAPAGTVALLAQSAGPGAIAGGEAQYNVGAQCRTFRARLAAGSGVSAGTAVTFRVRLDGGQDAQSWTVRAGEPGPEVVVDIGGAERLTLAAEAGGAASGGPGALWQGARLEGCVRYSGPIVVEDSPSGSTVITGAYRSDDPQVPAILIRTRQPVTIRDCTLAGRDELVSNGRAGYLSGTNVTVERCRGYGLDPGGRGLLRGRFLAMREGTRLIVRNNTFHGTSGIYIYTGRYAPGDLRIMANDARNIEGRRSDGRGGFLAGPGPQAEQPFSSMQFVQFNGVQAPGAEIAWNRVVNDPGNSRVEDNISMYASSGAAGTPIRIHHNLVRGAYNAPAGRSPYSGGGIITDGCLTRHVDISSNTVLNTSNHGISIAGGEDVTIRDNTVLGSGLLPGGAPSGGEDAGIYARWTGNCSLSGINLASNRITGNTVGFAQPEPGRAVGYNNLFVDRTKSGTPYAVAENNVLISGEPAGGPCLSCDPSPAVDAAQARWEEAARAAGVTVGAP